MPTERIYNDGPFDVDVAWGRDCDYVQVATIVADGAAGAERVLQEVREWLNAAGKPEIDLAELRKALPDTPPHFTGWHVQLNSRRQVNDLIRLLKKARDQAFGRDE